MEVKALPNKELVDAMQRYAVQANLFLEFIEKRCPKLSKTQSVELATLLIGQMAVILTETESADTWLNNL